MMNTPLPNQRQQPSGSSCFQSAMDSKHECCGALDMFLGIIPLLAITSLLGIYYLSPDFYLRYMLQPFDRETQIVELITFLCAAVAAGLLFYVSVKVWKRDWYRGQFAGYPGGGILLCVIALAALFFAGEEISWGQSWLNWETPEAFIDETGGGETNIHNVEGIPISIQSLGSLFLIVMFFGLPLAWKIASHQLPRDWEPAVAREWPVISCFALAFAWKWFKPLYLSFAGEDPISSEALVPWFAEQLQANNAPLSSSVFYMQFVEQINEHKEMLVAMGLLIYSIYRLRALRHTAA